MTQIGSFPPGLAVGQPRTPVDIVTALNQIKSVVNTSLDASNVTAGSLTDGVLAAPNNATYKQIIPSVGTQGALLANGTTYLLTELATTIVPSDGNAARAAGYLDPAWYTAGSKANKYNLRVSLYCNTTAPTSTFTVGLYPVTAASGGAGANTITLGTVTAGSTAAFVAPSGAPNFFQASSGDFTAPAAGHYAIGCAISVATMAANSAVTIRAILQHRQV